MSTKITTALALPEDPFEGTFAELLPEIMKYPGYVASPWGTIERLIQKMGRNEQLTAFIRELYGDDSLEAWNAFNNFYGTELADFEFMTSYIRPALHGHGAAKKACLWVGPPGAGKSDKLEDLKRIWRTGEPMPTLADSRINDNPLNLLYLVPREAVNREGGKLSRAHKSCVSIIEGLTAKVWDQLQFDEPEVKALLQRNGVEASHGGLASMALANVEDFVSVITYAMLLPKATRRELGMPEPLVQDRVFGKYMPKVEIADYPIGAMHPRLGHGLVVVPEVDNVNFKLEEWIGRRNIANMVRLPADHPLSVDLNGYYPKANRGLLELVEALKNCDPAQRINLTATQDKMIALPQPLASYHNGLHVSIFVQAHTNEQEYREFLADKKKEPYWDRFQRVYVKYPLRSKAAAKVTEKLWNASQYGKPVERGGVHVEPILFEYEGKLRTLASLEDDPQGVPIMVKLDAYDGEQAREGRSAGMGRIIPAADLRARASEREGMEGISPRQTAESVMGGLAERALSLYGDGKVKNPCVTTAAFQQAMFEYIKNNVKDKKKKELLVRVLSTDLAVWRRRKLSNYVRASFLPAFHTECQENFDKYIEWSNASVLGGQPKSAGSSRISKVEMDDWLRKIENMPEFSVSDGQKERFRREVQAAVARWREDNPGKRVPYTVHKGLQECIERFVLAAVTELVKMLTENTSKTAEQKAKLAEAEKNLYEQHGFCPHCAAELFEEVSKTKGFIID